MNKSESRYFHTAVRFDEALLALLEKKPFAYITVSELCKEADVNRSTFYLHYENMSDVLQETTKYLSERFVSYFADTHNAMPDYADCDLQDLNFINNDYLLPYLSFVKENQRMFSAVLSCQQTFDTEAIFQRLFEQIFQPILDRYHYPKSEQHYVMRFYLNGVTAVVRQWLLDGCEKSEQEISTILSHCILGKNEEFITEKARQ